MPPLTLYTRVLHITFAIVLALVITNLFHIERGYWVSMTVMIGYSSFSAGAVSLKIKQRILGTVIGLLFAFLFLKIFRIQPDLIYLVTLALFFCFYTIEKNYLLACILITVMVMLLFDYTQLPGVGPDQLFADRIIDTLIGILIVLFTELIFPNKKITQSLIKYHLNKCLRAYAKHLHILIDALSTKGNAPLDLSALHAMMISRSTLEQYLNDANMLKNKHNDIHQELINTLYNIRLNMGNIAFLIQHYKEDMFPAQNDCQPFIKLLTDVENKLQNIDSKEVVFMPIPENILHTAEALDMLTSITTLQDLCCKLQGLYEGSLSK